MRVGKRGAKRSSAPGGWALSGVSFNVTRGSMVGVVGTNGAGKSTLLRIIGGIVSPDSGRVVVPGRVGALELAPGFHPDLTGRESVHIGAVIGGLTRREARAHFDEIVSFAELANVIDDPLRTYSTGMRMRLAFAVAAHGNPDVLLVDEVLAVGDARFQRKCLQRIDAMRRGGCTILLVSHDTSLIAKICDMALWLEKGILKQVGAASDVVKSYISSTSDAPGANALQHGVNKFGNGQAEISDVKIVDVSGAATDHFHTGDGLKLSLSLQTHYPISELSVFVFVTRVEDGIACCDMSSVFSTPDHETRIRASLTVSRLDLARGSYFVDVGAYSVDGLVMFDYHWNAYSFTIVTRDAEGADSQTRNPVLEAPHVWSGDLSTEVVIPADHGNQTRMDVA